MKSKVLAAFSSSEKTRAYELLAARVAHMMGRKFEEGDWSHVYCSAKGIPDRGWSNLNIDVAFGSLGVEHKMLMRPVDKPITTWCGTTLMHPAATRAIRIDSLAGDPNKVMRDVFKQYADLIERRVEKIRQSALGKVPDMRTGWLLWQEGLREFVYFEERMLAPDPILYKASWNERSGGGGRLGSKNLWIYEKATGKKRFSVTTQAGIKIQPYFDVPSVDDPNLYVFVAQGERTADGLVRVWLTESTARALSSLLGSLDTTAVSKAILSVKAAPGSVGEVLAAEPAREVLVEGEAYAHLRTTLKGVSDEHSFRLLLDLLAADKKRR